ncbi:MAG: hypothetical protein KAI55_01025 [Candidatus Aenigmarchaeota archaeon]|nr:hypothetical protein [Candidatus Aenigmarchaeota archaeon]
MAEKKFTDEYAELNEEDSFDLENNDNYKTNEFSNTDKDDFVDLSAPSKEEAQPHSPEAQKQPYSRLGGPLFISISKYKQMGLMIGEMKKKIRKLKEELNEIKDLRNKNKKIFSNVLDDLEVVEENMREINDILKVKS